MGKVKFHHTKASLATFGSESGAHTSEPAFEEITVPPVLQMIAQTFEDVMRNDYKIPNPMIAILGYVPPGTRCPDEEMTLGFGLYGDPESIIPFENFMTDLGNVVREFEAEQSGEKQIAIATGAVAIDAEAKEKDVKFYNDARNKDQTPVYGGIDCDLDNRTIGVNDMAVYAQILKRMSERNMLWVPQTGAEYHRHTFDQIEQLILGHQQDYKLCIKGYSPALRFH